jgi:site-specific recombinase XerD
LIEAYFSLNDYIGLGAGAVRVRVYEIADHAGLGETRGYKDTVSHGRVPDLDAHTLRHTYGTNLARQGLEAAAIRDLMGHNSITTSNDYISYIGRRAADQLHNRY